MSRVGFKPILLEDKVKAPLEREHRLYQSDWLLRLYDYDLRDIKDILTSDGNLPKGDPKKHLAKQYFDVHEKIDPNSASKKELLRIPGIGINSVRRILAMRYNDTPIKSRDQLKSIGVVMKWADPYLKINGQPQFTLDQFKRDSSLQV